MTPCKKCNGMLTVAQIVLDNGYCMLSEAFKTVSPGVKYTAEHARRKLLQMPLVSINIGEQNSGKSFAILMEKYPDTDYLKISRIFNGLVLQQSSDNSTPLEKSVVKLLLNIAKSDSERKCLRFAIYRASGMSATQARKRYGFENMSEIEEAIKNTQTVHEAITDLANIEEKALLLSCGVEVINSSSSESETSSDELQTVEENLDILKSIDDVPKLLQSCQYNWFEIIQKIEDSTGTEINYSLSESLYEVYSKKNHISEDNNKLLRQSFFAYCSTEIDFHESDRIARSINGEVISESEADNAEDIVTVSEPLSAEGKVLIQKKRRAIQRTKKRKIEKAIAEKRLLCRRESKRASKILEQCPDIGDKIETFVQQHNVGADAWRRTGVLTFDGNVKLKEKVT